MQLWHTFNQGDFHAESVLEVGSFCMHVRMGNPSTKSLVYYGFLSTSKMMVTCITHSEVWNAKSVTSRHRIRMMQTFLSWLSLIANPLYFLILKCSWICLHGSFTDLTELCFYLKITQRICGVFAFESLCLFFSGNRLVMSSFILQVRSHLNILLAACQRVLIITCQKRLFSSEMAFSVTAPQNTFHFSLFTEPFHWDGKHMPPFPRTL